MPALTGVAHVTLSVRNLHVSEAWYCRLFDLERVDEEHRPHSDAVLLRHPSSSVVLSLRQHHGAGSARFDETRTGLDHVSFGVPGREALEEWEHRLAEHHVDHSPITDTGTGSVLVFRDPDHIRLELSCPNGHGRAGPARA